MSTFFANILFVFVIIIQTSSSTILQDYGGKEVAIGEDFRYNVFLNKKEPHAFVDEDNDGIDDFDKGKYMVESSNVQSMFTNRRSFSCPRVKPDLHTGDTTSNISPEDIDIVAALGDSLACGRGLWPPTDVEFRGAAFPIGGDANIDGLVTIPNIFLEFNEKLEGVSHGMGKVDQLPDYQFNTAEAHAQTTDLPRQAADLVRRLHKHVPKLEEKWTVVTVVIGTEEICAQCKPPDHTALRRTMGILRKGIPKALIVLIGPVHVASSYRLNRNFLRPRCNCLESMSRAEEISLRKEWSETFYKVQDEFNHLHYSTFAVLTIPRLTIHSRDPDSLFIEDQPLLNRKGHTYAAKFVWNRLIAGPNYNYTEQVFSEDSYFCPSVGCPYFRTVQNFRNCTVLSQFEYEAKYVTSTLPPVTEKPKRAEVMRRNLAAIIIVTLSLCALAVFSLGTAFYCHGLKATKGRFEEILGV